jgi:hypothetical protein
MASRCSLSGLEAIAPFSHPRHAATAIQPLKQSLHPTHTKQR